MLEESNNQQQAQLEMISPSNNLVWAILTTILCCLPLGIVSIVYAAKVDTLWYAGNYAAAKDASKKAGRWAMWSAIVSLIFILLYVLLIVLLGVGTIGRAILQESNLL